MQTTEVNPNKDKIMVITDTGSDISIEETQDLPLYLVPFHLFHEGVEFKEAYDMSKEDFYKILETSDSIPSTAQITVIEYLELYMNVLQDGYSHLIMVTINSTGSGTYNSALQALNLFYEDKENKKLTVEVVDSKTYSYVYGDGVLMLAKMAKDGKTFEECLEFIKDYFDKAEAVASTYSLKHAKMSGRISGMKAFIGEAMGIKPILRVKNHEVKNIDNCRGEKQINQKLIDTCKKYIDEPQNQVISLIYGSVPQKDVEELRQSALDQLGVKDVILRKFSSAITINIGPKTIALRYMGRKTD